MALNNTHLRVTFSHAPPFVWAQFLNGKLHVNGIVGHILQAMADFVPFSYDVVYDGRRPFGVRLANGTYTGVIGLLQNGLADIVAAPLLVRRDRTEVLTYMPTLYTSHCAIIAVAGEPLVNAFSYIFVFEWEVWLGLVVCIPVVATALAFVEKRRARNGGSLIWETYENTWDILRSFTYEGHPAPTKSHAGRLLFSIWWLTVLVLTNAFAGQLKASMAIKNEPPRFRSAEDVTLQPSIRPLIWRDTEYELYVRTSPKLSLRALTRQSQRHRGFVTISEMYAQSSLEQLYSGKAVIVSDRDVILTMLAKQCRLTGGSLYVVPELIFTRFGAMAHAKGLTPGLEERLHNKMTAIIESGLNLKWYDDGMREWYLCQAMQEELSSKSGELSFKVLRYEDVAAIFALWAIMAAFALFVFLLEMCLYGKASWRGYRLGRIKPRWNRRLVGMQAAQVSLRPSHEK